jgi:flavin-dependent thymidylate synthase
LAKYKRVADPWKQLRFDLGLFGNAEPEVKIVAITTPTNPYTFIETIPAIAASTSYGSTERIESDFDKAIALNKKLVQMGHHVPLESIQINFLITGISKISGAQLSRYRHTGHVSASRRFKTQEPQFVYSLLEDIKDEAKAATILRKLSYVNMVAFEEYESLRNEFGASKEAARMCIPGSTATSRYWWTNIRELRHIVNQRCRADTESELRRLVFMLFDLVNVVCPSLFEDIKDEMYKDKR